MTNICEECGREYTVNEWNENAPYAMCNACYDEYNLQKSEE